MVGLNRKFDQVASFGGWVKECVAVSNWEFDFASCSWRRVWNANFGDSSTLCVSQRLLPYACASLTLLHAVIPGDFFSPTCD